MSEQLQQQQQQQQLQQPNSPISPVNLPGQQVQRVPSAKNSSSAVVGGVPATGSAWERYSDLCKQSWVRPNSEVLRILEDVEQGMSISVLEFSRNYLGDAGGRALFACLRMLPMLAELNVRSNGLRDEAVVFLCNCVSAHPSLGVMDVSENEINDARGGKALVNLVTENIMITKLRCDNTRMTEKTKATITSTVLSNCRNAPKMLRKNAYETTSTMREQRSTKQDKDSSAEA